MSDPATDDAVVVAVDQGTSSTKAIAVDSDGQIVATSLVSIEQSHPRPGWVEQDAEAIFDSVRATIETLAAELGDRIVSVGLSTQRESAVVWDRRTGEALSPLIGWQDRRTTDSAVDLQRRAGAEVRSLSGLPLDPMFSALKLQWVLDEIDPDRSASRAGQIAVGTVDSYLLFRLTGEHRIEVGNASRTQLLDVSSGRWSPRLLSLFSVPDQTLPRIAWSDEPSAPLLGIAGLMPGVRVDAVLADSHAALFGHGARGPGVVKATYGTGSSVMGIAPPDARTDATSLVRTIAWGLRGSGGRIVHAFEGNILSTGASILWLGRLLGCDANEIDRLAQSVDDSAGVNFVPAFAGLGAPWWDPNAKAVIDGFDLGTTAAALSRAAFESIALQIEDVIAAAERELESPITRVMADGGPSRNSWLMQLQADLSHRTVAPTTAPQLSALGASHLAGLTRGVWGDDAVRLPSTTHTQFEPTMPATEREARRATWRSALTRSRIAVDAADTR